MAKIMTWEEAAKYCYDVFGVYVDLDERFFWCPECQEPLYFEDWEDHDWSMCPVCETYWEDIE